jgi:MFS family permease
LAAFVVRECTAARPVLPLRRIPALARTADLPGACLLGLGLAGVVLTFAAADPERRAVSPAAPYLLPASAVAFTLFAVRQRRARTPLVPRGALAEPAVWGALVASVLVGAALIAVLVDVPVFARVTRHGGDQVAAALVLLRFLAAVPVGALAGGWLTRRWGPRPVAAGGMAVAAAGLAAMAGWERDALGSAWSDVALVGCGLGFGLAVAPVNAAALAAARAEVHGLVSGLVVVARTVGMLVGLSTLTAIGLRVFYAREAGLPSPFDLCPDTPSRCPEYRRRLVDAVVDEVQVVFLGAAVCAVLAALAAWFLLRPPGSGQPNPAAGRLT